MIRTVALPTRSGSIVTRRFGGHRDSYRRFSQPGAPLNGHNGLDFACSKGEPLFACVDGELTERENDPTGYGLYGVITDADGTQWLYGHAEAWAVRRGERVRAGQTIAFADSTGNSTGHHLHFGRRPAGYNRADGYLGWTNPRPYLPIPYRVLLQAGHYPNAGGAPGEAAWAMRLAMQMETLLRRYVACEVIGDYLPPKTPPAETHSDWDLYASLHYDALQPHLGYTSGCHAARFEAEPEHWEADRALAIWLSRYPKATGIPLAMHRVSNDMRWYYGFRPLTEVTPGLILEHGCGMGDDGPKLHDGLAGIAAANVAVILEYLGITPDPAPQPGPGGEDLPMDVTAEEAEGMRGYFEQLHVPCNMDTAIMRRACLAHKRLEGRGPAVTSEYTTRNRGGVLVARQRFTGGSLDYHQEGEHQGETFWGEVVAHPEDAA